MLLTMMRFVALAAQKLKNFWRNLNINKLMINEKINDECLNSFFRMENDTFAINFDYIIY